MAFYGDFVERNGYSYSAAQFQYSSSNYACSYNYYGEPKFIEYDPTPVYPVHYFPTTKFTVSHSTVELNDPEFEEYDPTPYDGGYDQTMTYGKPLPPSDLTCYPRSLPKSDSPPLDNFPYHSIPSPYGKHDPLPLPIKPPKNTKAETESYSLPIEPPKDTKTETESHSLPINPPNKVAETESHVENGGRNVEIVEPNGGYSSYEHQNGYQIPYGSGLEAMDICETLFGYRPPCVAKKALLQQQQQQMMNQCQVCDQDRGVDSWKAAADYLFGTPLPYDYGSYHHQVHHRSDQISWLQ